MTVSSELYWQGCYRDVRGSDGLFTPESVSHPAKMTGGLLFRILDEAEGRGWFQRGMTLLDPFYGIGTTGLARLRGYNVVGVELEQRFMDMADGCDCTGVSKADWVSYFQMGADPRRRHRANYRDGRHWCPLCLTLAYDPQVPAFYVPRGTAGVIPCSESHHYEGNRELLERLAGSGIGSCVVVQGDSRNLATCLGADVSGVLTSPPYGETHIASAAELTLVNQQRAGQIKSGVQNGGNTYGSSPEQIGLLADGVVTSPPYGRDSEPHRAKPAAEWRGGKNWGGPNSVVRVSGYGSSLGQIGTLPDGVVTSPPWEDSEGSLSAKKFADVVAFAEGMAERDAHDPARHSRSIEATLRQFERQGRYGESEGQVGRLAGETYQDAMLEVYRSMHDVLSPGGVTAVVVKCPTRKWKLRRLDVDTWWLLQAAGFACWCPVCEEWVVGEPHDHPEMDREIGPVCGYRAVLAEELVQLGLFGGKHRSLIGRMSFFKRYYYKRGQPTALWEDVIFARRVCQ